MFVQNFGTNQQGQNGSEPVTVQTYETAHDYARALERLERGNGAKQSEARRQIARKCRIGSGTLENILRNRVKRVDEKTRDKLQSLLVRELTTSITRLQNELERARRASGVLAAQHVREIEAYLAKARSLLNGHD